MAKKKGKRPPKITDEKRDEMFRAFCEKQAMQYVARKCRVNRLTVVRYCEKDEWWERLAKIREQARRKVDYDASEMRARHIMMGKLFQKRSAEYLSENKLGTETVAIVAGQVGVRIEREAAGEPGEITQQKVVIELVDGDSDPTNSSTPGS
jgi:hypothetical protein